MSNHSDGYSADKIAEQLNHSMPVAKRAQLGTLLAQLIAYVAAASTAMISKAGLAIHGGGSTLVKAASPVLALFGGVPVRHAPADMPALVGNLATANSALWPFYMDNTGTLSTGAKTADAATHDAALALLPATPANEVLIGFVVVDNATGANFVGGTTALDAANLTVTYYDVVGAAPVGVAVIGDLASR